MEFVRICLLILGVAGCAWGHGHSCKVSEIKVQKDLDLSRLGGYWFEIKFVAYQFIPKEYRFVDYARKFESNKGNGGIDVKGSLRYTVGGNCSRYDGFLAPSKEPGKLFYTRPDSTWEGAEMVTSPLWIISTDYENYMLTYSCPNKHVTVNGTCDLDKVESSVWVSDPWKDPEGWMERLDGMIRHLCLDPDKYLSIKHDKACDMVTGASHRYALGYTVVLSTLMLWAII